MLVMETLREDRGTDIEKIIVKLSSLPIKQKELILEYLEREIASDKEKTGPKHLKIKRTRTSSLQELILLYPNVDFAGFISRDNDKEQYQLWKLIDAFEEVANEIGHKNFDKLHITLIVFGDRINYVSDGSIAVNYERFSKEDLVNQLIRMFHSQG
jgi:hypothetical protein